MAKKHIEPQIYRVVTPEEAMYIRAIEVVPGLLIHPDVIDKPFLYEDDLNDEMCSWSISHKDSGRYIVGSIMEKNLAIRACRKLNALCNADCERHWLTMNEDWVVFARKLRDTLPFTETWPKELG